MSLTDATTSTPSRHRRRPHEHDGLVIDVVTGTGTGPTKLAAFDAALRDAGVANYNLCYLSSVIPPEAEVRTARGRGTAPPGTWGDRLYVVMAQQRVEHPAEEAWAGIGWVQDPSGRGLFVEHVGHTAHEVETLIDRSLGSMVEARALDAGPVQRAVIGTRVVDEPACAVACAIYEAATWGAGAPSEIRLP